MRDASARAVLRALALFEGDKAQHDGAGGAALVRRWCGARYAAAKARSVPPPVTPTKRPTTPITRAVPQATQVSFERLPTFGDLSQ